MSDFLIKKVFYPGLFFLFLILSVSFFDKGLAAGLFLVVFLTGATLLILSRLRKGNRELCLFFLTVLLIHLAAALFIYYTGFRPVGGGADFEGYHQNAAEVASRFSRGNFSLEGLYTNHYFPVLIGVIYIFSAPQMIVGQLFVAWLAVFSLLLSYFLILETGGSEKSAFFTGFAASFYPSFLYFGSLLLKDAVVIPLVLAGLLLAVKMLKNFDGLKFSAFFIFLTGLLHFRFYIGFALMFSFIICWFVLANLKFGEKFIYGLTIIFLLGFSPQLLGYGYYGTRPLQSYLNKETIKTYREVVYAPSDYGARPAEMEKAEKGAQPAEMEKAEKGAQPAEMEKAEKAEKTNKDEKSDSSESPNLEENSGKGSSFVVSAGFDSPFNFVKNYLQSFIYSLFGPFPWQLRYKRHLLFLSETIPWYFLWLVASYGVFKLIKEKGFKSFLKVYKFSLPLLMFSVMALAALSLYINNFGIVARVRMSMFFALLCVMSLSLDQSILAKVILRINFSKIYEKIFGYRGSRIHRFQSCWKAFGKRGIRQGG